jgi:hypothetical protein
MFGATSGNLTVKPAAAAGANTILTLPGGTTDFSATGGTSQVVNQTSVGGAFTVGQLASTDLSDTANIDLLNAAQTYTAAKTFGEVHGDLPEAVTLTSNDYVATTADCGKTKTLPTGRSPTVHLPNLNVGCTTRFITTAAISYQFLAASGGSTINCQNFTHTRGTNAGDSVSVEIVTPSASAAKWNFTGDLTS